MWPLLQKIAKHNHGYPPESVGVGGGFVGGGACVGFGFGFDVGVGTGVGAAINEICPLAIIWSVSDRKT